MAYFVLVLLKQLQANALDRHINQSSYCEIALSKKKLFMEELKCHWEDPM